MSTRATAFSRRTGKIQQDFDDIATVQRPAERTNKFYNLLKNIVSSVKNFGMKDRFKKYKAKSPDKKHKKPVDLVHTGSPPKKKNTSPRSASSSRSSNAVIIEPANPPPKKKNTSPRSASSSRSSNAVIIEPANPPPKKKNTSSSSPISASSSRTSNPVIIELSNPPPKKTKSSPRSASSSRSSNAVKSFTSGNSKTDKSSSRSASSSNSATRKQAHPQSLLQKGVIYHTGKITIEEIKIWQTKSKEIHTIILDNFQFIDNKLYNNFLDFLGSCTNLKNLIIKRKDKGEHLKIEVDYFQDAFFLNIGKLENLKLLELNSLEFDNNDDDDDFKFFSKFIIYLAKLIKLENLILINNYMNTNTGEFKDLMFKNKQIDITGSDIVKGKSYKYRYDFLKSYDEYRICIQKYGVNDKPVGELHTIYLNAVGNKSLNDDKNLPGHIQDKTSGKIQDYKNKETINIRDELLKDYDITINDT